MHFQRSEILISSELSGGMCVVLPIIIGNEVAVSTPQTSDLKPANDVKLSIVCLFPCTVTFPEGKWHCIGAEWRQMNEQRGKKGIRVRDSPKLTGKGDM